MNNIFLLPCLMMYYSVVSVLFLLSVWCPCMAINVSVQYVCMYVVCMVIIYSRVVWINRVRLPILLVVS